jgi:hypothetical protein
MKRFTKLVENIESEKYYKVTAEIELVFKTYNEGEAGYLADSDLGSLESQVDFRISDISEVSESEYKEMTFTTESYGTTTDGEKILKNWESKFFNKIPNTSEKMEFYHEMRLKGFEGDTILSTIDKM